MLVSSPSEADKFVSARVADGSDYVKTIAGIPGLNAATINALAAAAHIHGKRAIAHTITHEAASTALRAGVDVLTRAPLDAPLTEAKAQSMPSTSTALMPTLTMMKAAAPLFQPQRPGVDYAHARASVAACHRAGVPVLAGTDSSRAPFRPPFITHGASQHDELELLVDTGLSCVDALRVRLRRCWLSTLVCRIGA